MRCRCSPPARWRPSGWISWPARATGRPSARGGGIGGKTLVAGVVDGRNVWRTDLRRAFPACGSLLGLAGELMLSTSCSLLHVPLDVGAETSITPQLRGRLAFARQKVDEVVALGRALSEGRDAAVAPGLASAGRPAAPVNARVRARLDALGAAHPAPRLPPSAAPPSGQACRSCRRPRSGRSRRPRRSVRARAEPQGRAASIDGAYRGRYARRDRPDHRAAGGHRPGRARPRRA